MKHRGCVYIRNKNACSINFLMEQWRRDRQTNYLPLTRDRCNWQRQEEKRERSGHARWTSFYRRKNKEIERLINVQFIIIVHRTIDVHIHSNSPLQVFLDLSLWKTYVHTHLEDDDECNDHKNNMVTRSINIISNNTLMFSRCFSFLLMVIWLYRHIHRSRKGKDV